ncbi:MAG: M67 family metallopeptidase, partial [Bacteroidota bacterium]
MPRSLLTEIYGHSQRAYPEECCGFLLGRSSDGQRLVIQTQPTSNARIDERQRRFLINPDEYLRTEAESKAKDLEIIGFYHSHPDHEARPSS